MLFILVLTDYFIYSTWSEYTKVQISQAEHSWIKRLVSFEKFSPFQYQPNFEMIQCRKKIYVRILSHDYAQLLTQQIMDNYSTNVS